MTRPDQEPEPYNPDDPGDYTVPDTAESLSLPSLHRHEEPPSDMRQTSVQMRQYYVSLVQAGFSRAEAMEFVKSVIMAAIAKGPANPDE